MKINIGCGSVYKKGFINVDAFDSSVADKIMNAYDLDFEDGSVDYIECSHVLEHMGAVQGVYAISEFYRVLKPGGVLKIATPDIEQSFHNFIWKEYEDRKYMMNWIYGLDVPGMNHRYAYPQELLQEILYESGFVEIEIKKRNEDSNYPELIARSKKPLGTDLFDMISKYRHVLVRSNVIQLNDQIIGLDQDRLIQRTTQVMLESSPNEEFPLHVIADICIESPAICVVLLRFLRESGYPISLEIIDATERLRELDFPEILSFMLQKLPDSFDSPDESLGSILELARKSVMKVLDPDQRDSTLSQLHETRRRITAPIGIPLFSEEAIQRAAKRIFSQGLKSFAKSDYEAAQDLMMRSLALNRSDLLVRWNLARLTIILEGTGVGLKRLEELLHMRSVLSLRQDPLNVLLRKDIQSIRDGDFESLQEPLYSLP
ncbi:MAG: methyltransferase domain-containing protein [Candidatus Thorarchaeota archaeon]